MPALNANTAIVVNAGGTALTNSTGTLTLNGNLSVATGKTLTANSTLTLAGTDSKTLSVNNSLTLAGTDGTTMTFPSTSATIARTDAGNTFTGHQTIEGVTSTGATGTGNLVFSASPTLTGTLTAAAANFSGAVTAPSLLGSTLTVGTNASAPVIFDMNSSEAARIDTSKNVLINQTSVSAASGKLDVLASLNAVAARTTGVAVAYTACVDNASGFLMEFYYNNYNTVLSYWTTNGSTTTFNNPSDERFKKFHGAVDLRATIRALEIQPFNWTDNEKAFGFGLSAQKLYAALPEGDMRDYFVRRPTERHPKWNVSEGHLPYLALWAAVDNTKRIDALEAQIAELKRLAQ